MSVKLTLFALFCLCPGVLSAAPHRYDHVVIVVEENRAVGSIIGDLTNAPYINSLAAGGVSMGRMFSIEHPSQPNYFQLFSGDNQGVEDDGLPPNFSVTPTVDYPMKALNLGAELIAAGFTFAGYSEELEAAGATDWADYDPHSATAPGVTYRRKHNPWANWVAKVSPVPANQMPASVNKAFTQFPSDFALLPSVSFVIPNQNHDMHDGSRKTGDTWLQTNLDDYAQWAKTNNSLLVITWDEDDFAATNQIATVLYGANLREGSVAGGTWTHHNMLRTLEDMYATGTHAGSAALVRPIVGPFSNDPTVVIANFRQGLNAYAGVKDTVLREDAPTADNALTVDLLVDRDSSSATGNQSTQVLMRFDNLFGNGSGQVPANAIIHSCKLITFTPLNGSSFQSDDAMRAHRMIADWSDSATYDSFTGGVDIDGIEAAVDPTFSFVPEVDGAPVIIDVTADVELFQSGTATNYGWLLRASSSGSGDGWTMKSSEFTGDVIQRPTLEIVYSLPTASPYETWAAAALLDSSNNAPGADPDQDGNVNLLEFAFGTDPKAANTNPASAQILSQVLQINFPQRKNAGLTYTAEFSSNLKDWSGGQAPVVTDIDVNWDQVTVKDAMSGAQRYVRMIIDLVP
jgi:hypothetical protein